MEPEGKNPVIGTVEDYQLHFKLGEGGQANVYLGSKDQQLYALKVYLPGMSKEEAFRV
jgi:serine/threonine protein kinase